jgi:hypothetical protein
MTVRDASELIYPAVQETIATLGLLGTDSAAAKLAQRYAKTIDQALDLGPKVYFATLRWIGPLLLDTLKELGATPAARAALLKNKPAAPETKPNGLAALRAAK